MAQVAQTGQGKPAGQAEQAAADRAIERESLGAGAAGGASVGAVAGLAPVSYTHLTLPTN